ncbi:MAG: hypothetical protein PHH22_03720 [Clostridia bacterium]|nr:hypothetical protein [Clostridia bacterium]
MEIKINSEWLAYALNIEPGYISIKELSEIKVLNFNLVEYINQNNDVAILDDNDYNKVISNSERISKTNQFLSELFQLSSYINLSYVDISGLNLQDSNFDCLYNFKDLRSLELTNNDNSFLDLKKFNNLKTMNIYLDDCKTGEVQISKQTAKSIGVYDKPTQYDMYKAVRRKTFTEMPIKMEDMSSFETYTVNIPSICVSSMEDIENVRNVYNTANLSINTIELKNLVELQEVCDEINKMINEFPDRYSFNQTINDVSELNMSQLSIMKDTLKGHCKFDNINVLRTFDTYEEYDVDKYADIRQIIDIIIESVDNNLPDAKKVVQIEKILASGIAYDRDALLNAKSEKLNKKSIDLEDGLLNGKCVCGGFADIFRNVLACCNIDAKTIDCLSEGNGHSYNQVKVDEIWYNVDLTYDIYEILSGADLNNCLQSDVNFKNSHRLEKDEIKYGNVEKCNYKYNQQEINEYNRNNAMSVNPMSVISSIEGTKQAIDEYVINTGLKNQYNIRQDILDVYNNGMNLCFSYDNNNGNYKVVFGGKDSISEVVNITPSYMNKEGIVETIKLYLDRYEKSNIGQSNGNITMIQNDKGINLVLGKELVMDLKDYGIDLSYFVVNKYVDINEKRDINKEAEVR